MVGKMLVASKQQYKKFPSAWDELHLLGQVLSSVKCVLEQWANTSPPMGHTSLNHRCPMSA